MTYDWDAEGHCVKGNGGDEHDDEDNPNVHQYGCLETRGEEAYQRVRLPTSPASW